MEKNNRLVTVGNYLKEYSLTHLLVSQSVVVEYISSFHASNAYLLMSPRSNLLFTDFRYKKLAMDFSAKNKQWRYMPIEQNGFEFLQGHLSRGDRVGVMADCVTLDQFDRMKKTVKGCVFVPVGTSFHNAIEAVKTAPEIALMRKAAAIGDKGFATLLSKLRIGMTEIEAARILVQACNDAGSQKESFDTIVLFGANAALPHGRPSARKLKKNDLVLCDFGCKVGGFCSDMTRTLFVGKADPKQRDIYEIVLDAQQSTKKFIKAGVTGCDADAIARSIITDAGYGDQFGHGTGHGVGINVHEYPRVAKSNPEPLPEGAVVTVEPGIYLPGFCGVRIEDMVVVEADGCTSLTRTPRKLVEISL